MAFNAGGTNVGGVQSIEAGQITITEIDTTLSVAEGETQNIDMTVPAGKKWIIKAASTSSASFDGTMNFQNLKLGLNAKFPMLQSVSGINYLRWQATSQITLKAGDKVRFSIATTAWTSGQVHCDLVYQELSV